MSDTTSEQTQQVTPKAFGYAAMFATGRISRFSTPFTNFDEVLENCCKQAELSPDDIRRMYLGPSARSLSQIEETLSVPSHLEENNTIAAFMQEERNEETLIRRAEALKERYNQQCMYAVEHEGRTAYPASWSVAAGLALLALAVFLFTSDAITGFLADHAFAIFGVIGLVLLVVCFFRGSFGILWGYLICMLLVYMAGQVVMFFRDDPEGLGLFQVIQFILAVPIAALGIGLLCSFFRSKRMRRDWIRSRAEARSTFIELYLMACFSAFEPLESPALGTTEEENLITIRMLRDAMKPISGTALSDCLVAKIANCLLMMHTLSDPLPICTEEEVTDFLAKKAAGVRKGVWPD